MNQCSRVCCLAATLVTFDHHTLSLTCWLIETALIMDSDERVRVVFGQCKHDLSKDWLRVKQYRGHRTYSIYNLDERRLIRYVKDYFRVFFCRTDVQRGTTPMQAVQFIVEARFRSAFPRTRKVNFFSNYFPYWNHLHYYSFRSKPSKRCLILETKRRRRLF